jgi:Zn-dependent protease
MPTGGSIQLIRLFGIRIGVNPSWFLVLFLFIFVLSSAFQDVLGGSSTQAYVVAVLAALLFLCSLILHELGHALVARRAGIEIDGIDLWFFGGIAKMNRDSRTPGEEFRIAAAGPLVTLLIVGICLGVGVAVTGSEFIHAAIFQSNVSSSPVLVLASWLASINALLFVFNLVPAFPLDGGRIARAIAWRISGDRARATRISARAGQGFAYLLAGFGIFLILRGNVGNGLWLLILSFFLGSAARGALVQSALDERLEGVTVADVMDTQPFTLDADMRVIDASERIFEPHGWPWVAVVEHDGRFAGVLTREQADETIASGRPALAVRDALAAGDEPFSVGVDAPLEDLLGAEGLRRIGAVFAVDERGTLRGVVTVDQVRRALTPAPGPRGA